MSTEEEVDGYTVEDRLQALEDSFAQESAARQKIQQWISQNLRNTLQKINEAVTEVSSNLQSNVEQLQQQLDEEREARAALEKEIQTLRSQPPVASSSPSKDFTAEISSLQEKLSSIQSENENIKNDATKTKDLLGLALEELEDLRNSKPAEPNTSNISPEKEEALSRAEIEELIDERIQVFKGEIKVVIDKIKRGVVDLVDTQIKKNLPLATPAANPAPVTVEKQEPLPSTTPPLTSSSTNAASNAAATAAAAEEAAAKRAEKQRQIRENAEKQEREKREAQQKSLDAQREARLQKDREEAERIRREEQDLQRIRDQEKQASKKKPDFFFGDPAKRDLPKAPSQPVSAPEPVPEPTPTQVPQDEEKTVQKKSIPSAFLQDSNAPVSAAGLDTVCQSCSKRVYMSEKISIDGKVFHRACFRCSHCNLQLKLSNYSPMDDRFFCKPHYKQLFQTHGNYNEGFGKQKLTANWSTSQDTQTPEPTPEPTPQPQPQVQPQAQTQPQPQPQATVNTANKRQVPQTSSSLVSGQSSTATPPAATTKPTAAPKKVTPPPKSLFADEDEDDDFWK